MKSKWIDKEFSYDGTQLRSLFGYLDHGLLGDSIVSWVGPCRVSKEHMVDGEDLLENQEIRGDKMLHFIVEAFGVSLFAGVGLQRLLTSIAMDAIKDSAESRGQLSEMFRDGDDIFIKDHKLSISIATQSPLSSMIHFAINISNTGTPVKTMCLEDFGITAKVLSEKIMEHFCDEFKTMKEATQKVRWVK